MQYLFCLSFYLVHCLFWLSVNTRLRFVVSHHCNKVVSLLCEVPTIALRPMENVLVFIFIQIKGFIWRDRLIWEPSWFNKWVEFFNFNFVYLSIYVLLVIIPNLHLNIMTIIQSANLKWHVAIWYVPKSVWHSNVSFVSSMYFYSKASLTYQNKFIDGTL